MSSRLSSARPSSGRHIQAVGCTQWSCLLGCLLVAAGSSLLLSDAAEGIGSKRMSALLTSHIDVKTVNFQRCHVDSTSVDARAASDDLSPPYDDLCPKGWSANMSATRCCLVQARSDDVREAQRLSNDCCAPSQCASSASRLITRVYLCPDSDGAEAVDNNATTATPSSSARPPGSTATAAVTVAADRGGRLQGNTTGILHCCGTVCCVDDMTPADHKAKAENNRWILLLSLSVTGSALIVIASALYICWRQVRTENKSVKFTPMTTRKQGGIRMSPPTLQMKQHDISSSEVAFPTTYVPMDDNDGMAETSLTSGEMTNYPTAATTTTTTSIPSPTLIDTAVLQLSTQPRQFLSHNGQGEVRIDVPFVRRARVQPSSMQNIIPR